MAIPAQASPVFGLQLPLSVCAHPSQCSWPHAYFSTYCAKQESSTTKLHALWRSITFGNLRPLAFNNILQALQIKLNCPSQLTFYSNAHKHLQTYYIIPESGLFQAEVIPSSILVHPVPSSNLLHWQKNSGNIMASWCSLLMFCCLFFPWWLLPFAWLVTLNTDVFLPGISITSTFCSNLFYIWDFLSPVHEYHIYQYWISFITLSLTYNKIFLPKKPLRPSSPTYDQTPPKKKKKI